MLTRRAASWIALALAWNVVWAAGFLALVRSTRGPDYVAQHLPDGLFDEPFEVLLEQIHDYFAWWMM